MNIYHVHDFKEDEYSWNEVGRKKAKQGRYIRWTIAIVNIVLICIVAYLDCRYNLLEMNGFLCWLLAIIVLAWGFTICYASYVRKHACKMSLEERHDFNQYLYHHKYWKNPILANQALLNNAIILVKMKQYEQAAQALDVMHIEKCKAKEMKLIYFLRIIIASFKDDEEEIEKAKIRYTGIKDDAGNYPASELVENWIQMNDLEQMTACLEQMKPVKKEYPGLAFVVTIFLAYTFWFLGTAYGINRGAGYEIRYVFSAISLIVVNMGLFVMLILGIIWLHRHLNITSPVWIQKVVKFIICAVIAIAGLILLFINFLDVFLGLDDKETVTRKENGYTYLEVSWSNMGYNVYTAEYVTNNPFIMKKIYVPKYLFVLSRVFSSTINLLASFTALILVMLAMRVELHYTVLLVSIPLIFIVLFSLGVGLILSAITVKFRDIMHLYSVFVTALMYLTPVIYPMSILPAWLTPIVKLNPITNILQMFRNVMIYNSLPSIASMIIAIVECLIMLVFGLYVFYKNQDDFILYI
jgi:hypothetical protein